MLRQLPFIREDFLKQRADEYPIRLWTLAVFSFGALPLLRKRGINRLVIGDELDTTVRKSFNGINHYDGLYDQSRFGDHAMSRYYQRKRWGLSQFSILRPLSELLIEKVLIERYPDIQRFQVSCHATHVESDWVRPCGRCEKCTRVVGMLTALGADPLRCGYKQEQISGCLAQLSAKGALQENAALEELGFLLEQRGLLPSGKIGKCTARERKHIIQMRFDPDRSQPTDIPVDLREPLYRILLEHAAGASRREERKWVDFDLLADPAVAAPFVYEATEAGEDGAEAAERRPGFLLGELTWPEAQKRFQEVDIALLPVGAIEQHGRHLPLDTDAFDAFELCCAAAERSSDPKPLVLPLIPYGVSYHHEDFAGTISIGPETLSRLVYEVGMAAARHGIAKLLIVNGHGGNAPTLQFAAQLINRDAEIFTCVDSGETSDADVEALAETHGDVHAGEVETSTSLANRPHLVQMDKARRFVPRFSSHYLDFSSKRSVEWFARTHKISPEGVLGDPTKASREKGEKMWNLIIDHLVSLIEDLKGMSLDEIHQKSRI
jgi:creatinine amidohydrolase/Fe(II)-dependent formamide hydrolase-like protein